jgi:hypothetical protein
LPYLQTWVKTLDIEYEQAIRVVWRGISALVISARGTRNSNRGATLQNREPPGY